MTRRARVDAELVRRGLARSRQQAAELIGAGRVQHRRHACRQTRDRRRRRRAASPSPAPTSAAGCRAARTSSSARSTRSASRSTAAAAWMRARRPAVSPRCCWTAAPREVVAADVGYGQLAWSLRSDARVTVHGAHQRPRADRRDDRRAGRPGGRRPVVHLAGDRVARARVVRVGGRRYRSHGEATVRGRQGPGRAGRGGVGSRASGPTRCCRSRAGPPNWTGRPSMSRRARCPARRATSSTSCGCARGPTIRSAASRWSTPYVAPSKRGRNDRRTHRSCWSCTPAATRPPRRPGGWRRCSATTASGFGCSPPKQVDHEPFYLAPDEISALGADIEVVDADERAAEGCETGARPRR